MTRQEIADAVVELALRIVAEAHSSEARFAASVLCILASALYYREEAALSDLVAAFEKEVMRTRRWHDN